MKKLEDLQYQASTLTHEAFQAGYAAGFEAAKSQFLAHLGATQKKRRGRPPKKK